MRKWKLGEDVSQSENLLDPVTFAELIMTLRCNRSEITEKSIRAEMKRIMDIRLQDMNYLLDNNIEEIIAAATKK